MRLRLTGMMVGTLALIAPAAMGQSRGMERVVTPAGEEVLTYSSSHALIVGVSRYTNGWSNLPGVEEDVREVRKALSNQGFEVEVAARLDKAGLEATLADFLRRHGYGAANRNKRLVIYFALHGETVEVRETQLGFIVPADAPRLDRANPADFQAGAISMSQITTLTEQVGARHLLVVFDSCFSGSVFKVMRSAPDQPPPAIRSWMAQPVQHFITAGTAGQQVPDRSIFRRKFVLGLQGKADMDSDGFISGTEFGYFLEREVLHDSHGQQQPRQGKPPGISDGEFIFAVHKPTQRPSPSAQELRDACLNSRDVKGGSKPSSSEAIDVLTACPLALEGVYHLNHSCSTENEAAIKEVIITEHETIIFIEFHPSYGNHGISVYPPGDEMAFYIKDKENKKIYNLLYSSGVSISPSRTNIKGGESIRFKLVFEKINMNKFDLIEGRKSSSNSNHWHFTNVKLQ